MSEPGPMTVSRLRHDLRTYVNHLQGYGEMILETAEDDGQEELVEAIADVLEIGRELLRCIAQRLPTHLADLSAPILDALRDDLAPLAERADASIGELLDANSKNAEVFEDLSKVRHAVHGLIGLLASRLAEPIESHAGGEGSTQGPSDGGACILVVDDIAANRDLLRRRLEREGHQVLMAGDGKAAVERIEKGDLDLVLLDILMPELDGFQVLAQVKSTPAGRDLPIIMISSLDEIDSVVRCIEMGAEDFLPKPFDPVLLRARVNACLQKKRFRDQELEYLENVNRVIGAASALEAGKFDEAALSPVADRPDALGTLARVFQRMAREVEARENRLKMQVQQLKIEIDEARKTKEVAEVVDGDFFQRLQQRAGELRERSRRKGNS